MLQFGTTAWPKFVNGVTSLSARYFNPIFELIDRRLHGIEGKADTFDQEAAKFSAIGLQRLDEVLGPSFERLGRIAELGFLIAHSDSSRTLVVNGVSTFVIQDLDERELFHASKWVTLTRIGGTSGAFALAQVNSYEKVNGILDVTVKQIVGISGAQSDWEIISGSGITIFMQAMADSVTVDKAIVLAAKAAALQAAADTSAAAIIIAGGPVSSVNGQTGTVTLTAANVGAMSAAQGVTLANDINTSVATALAAQNTATNTALAAKEKLWRAPAAYDSGVALDHQHIRATATMSLDLIATTSAIGDRFRIAAIGSGFSATLNGTGVRFRNPAGAWVTEPFVVNVPGVTHEFVKVAATDWEKL